ncbi:hypothetical protein Moror_9914 [Moniliophthora roreri MCA 2997]|uniref:Methyltransferase domain-containing protein n=1 Tax=Moniliophthora roreri (strain MCA 2997) TaxID=1381753 RepID=V2WVU0_MONRO|nr:hypothetical protein Moror_9914 [Moniliophthora roreri MCA 2997]
MPFSSSWSRKRAFLPLVVFVFVALYLLETCYLGTLTTLNLSSSIRLPNHHDDPNLYQRLELANIIYEQTLWDRNGLIEKFGPEPKDIAMFPENKEPWPAYTVWDFFPPAYNCPYEVQRIGSLGDGGKWVCGLSRLRDKKDCIIYSFGINAESSFEAELLSHTRYCEIWGYDFSVSKFGPQIPEIEKKRTHFFPFGLAGTDEPTRYPIMYTLQSIMQQNSHTHIDILKIDIESWEFEALSSIINQTAPGAPLPFGQLLLEIHVWDKTFEEFYIWWLLLEEAGLRPFRTEANVVYQNYNRQRSMDLAEYSFLNIKGENIFISDRET